MVVGVASRASTSVTMARSNCGGTNPAAVSSMPWLPAFPPDKSGDVSDSSATTLMLAWQHDSRFQTSGRLSVCGGFVRSHLLAAESHPRRKDYPCPHDKRYGPALEFSIVVFPLASGWNGVSGLPVFNDFSLLNAKKIVKGGVNFAVIPFVNSQNKIPFGK